MNKKQLNESRSFAEMTAAELKSVGATSVTGFGGTEIPLNSAGFMKFNGEANLPDGMFNKLSGAWSGANGDVDAFYNTNIDGQSVKDILSQCPSQQSYAIGTKLGLPEGTGVPCQQFTENNYHAIRLAGSGSEGREALAGVNSGTNEIGVVADPSPVDSTAGSDITSPSDTTDTTGASDGIGGTDGVSDGTSGPVDDGGAATGADPNWWAFFGTKNFLIGVAAVAGILAAIKALGNTIKGRFQKCAKVLYKMQKDFGTKETGMDMKAVLPGVGSGITDWITKKLWGKRKGSGQDTGALGLRPFVSNYVNEISGDYDESIRAFNLIAASAEASKAAKTTSGASDNYEKRDHTQATSSGVKVGESVVYESFAQAFGDSQLNESYSINESAIGMTMLAASLLVRGLSLAKGQFVLKAKDKAGNEVVKNIAVTKKSTREVCYAILNVFYGKYFDLNKVFSKIGINDFSDIDVNNVEKFERVAVAFTKEQETSARSKMYVRVKENYTRMVDAYLGIARKVVSNFETYTRKKKLSDAKKKDSEFSEKDSNLLTAAKTKLTAELDRQKDAYENNFPRVLNAIVSSEEYVKFCDFIIEKVIPVFKTGLAGEADYALDLLPKVNEYYIIRQTGQQANLENGDEARGNIVLARVLKVNKEGSEEQGAGRKISITFARTALLKREYTNIPHDNRLVYDLSSFQPDELDRSAFGKTKGANADRSENGDNITLPYGAWLSLDPRLAINVPGASSDEEDTRRTKLYRREIAVNGKNLVEYAFGEIPISHEGVTTREFEEDMNISEDEKMNTIRTHTENAEEDPNSKTENITKVYCVNIAKDQEEQLLTGDISTLQFTGSIVSLKSPCSALKLNEILVSEDPKFSPLDGKVKEKDVISDLISQQKGYTHVSNIQLENVDRLVEVIKQIETRQTTSEKLIFNANERIDEFVKELQSMNLQANQITQPFAFAGASAAAYDFYTLPRQNSADPYYKELPTGVADKANNQVIFNFYPTLIDANGNLIKPQGSPRNKQEQQPPQGILAIVICAKNHAHGPNNNPIYHVANASDIESIKKSYLATVQDLIKNNIIEPERGKDLGAVQNQNTQPVANPSESFNISYSDMFNLAESFMGTLSYLKVNRFITVDNASNDQYYVLSENAWGDGIVKDPENYLNKFVETVNETCKTYDDFAHLAKSSVSINFMPLTEDCTYKTRLPYNRFQMLTVSNPLYESTMIVTFNDDQTVKNITNLGISKIAK